MSQSIISELIAENALLREQIKNQEFELSYSITDVVLSDKGVKIRGVLIAEGVWKGIKYDYDQMKKSIGLFSNIMFKVDHGHGQLFGDKDVGKLDEVKGDDTLRALTFVGTISDPKAVELVVSKQLDSVSIKGKFDTVSESTTPPIGMGFKPYEVSLTASPACDFCQIFNVELSKCLKEGKDSNSPLGENTMVDFELKENELLVDPENLADDAEGEFFIMKVEEYNALPELTKTNRTAYVLPPGKYPVELKKAVKKKGCLAQPKYPYYKYEKYGSPAVKKLSDTEVIDVLDLAEDYKTFMKNCLAGGKDIPACAIEWKTKKEPTNADVAPTEEKDAHGCLVGKEEWDATKNACVPITEQPALEDEFEMTELADFKCPVCDFTGKNIDEFKKHWLSVHKDKYGQYKQARKLAKDLITKSELKSGFKRVLELTEEPKPEPKPEDEKPKDKPPEEKPIVEQTPPPAAVVVTPPPKEEEPQKSEEELIKELSGDPKRIADILLQSERKKK